MVVLMGQVKQMVVFRLLCLTESNKQSSSELLPTLSVPDKVMFDINCPVEGSFLWLVYVSHYVIPLDKVSNLVIKRRSSTFLVRLQLILWSLALKLKNQVQQS